MVRSSSAAPLSSTQADEQQQFYAATNPRGGILNQGGLSSTATPLGVMLVSKDESAERVLFMYPFEPRQFMFGGERDAAASTKAELGNKEGSAEMASEELGNEDEQNSGPIGLPVKMLAPLLCAKGNNDNGAPFEIKVDNVRFAGFPWHIADCVHSLAVVFILHGSADAHIVEAFQRLSKKIAIAVNTEQQRCNYLREQICLMQPAHDEFEALPDEQRKQQKHSPYEAILDKSGLAKHLRDIFEDVCEYGMVDVFVDDCIEVGFCIEPKTLCQGLVPRSSVEVEAMMRRIRAYHGLLFLEESVPSPDSNPFVRRFLEEYEPSRSIEEMGMLSGLPLPQVLQIVRHYLLWARAVLIYPICTSNVYANSPTRPQQYRALEAAFNAQFGAQCSLAEVLEAVIFSPLCSLGSFLQDTAIYAGQPNVHMAMLVFLLRNQLLVQVHTFFFLLPPASNQIAQQPPLLLAPPEDGKGASDEEEGQLDDERNHNRLDEQQQRPPLLSARIRTCVSAAKELSAALKQHVLDICTHAIHSMVGVPEPDMFWLVSTFLTFVPFLGGKNHLEDIIYRTHLDRSTVMRVLDTFSALICTFYCQDLIVDD